MIWKTTHLYSLWSRQPSFWVFSCTHTHIHKSILTLTGLNDLISDSKIFFILFRENKIIPNPSKKLNQGQSAKASTSKPSKSQFTFIYMQGQQVHHVNFCNVCIAMEKNGFYTITGHSWKFWIGHQSKCGELERLSKCNPEHGYHPQLQGKYVSDQCPLYIFTILIHHVLRWPSGGHFALKCSLKAFSWFFALFKWRNLNSMAAWVVSDVCDRMEVLLATGKVANPIRGVF